MEQLARAVFCTGHVPRAQILTDDHRAAGGQRRKDVDDEHIQHIHQRHTRDGRLARVGYHHCVRHAHRYRQKLLHHQRGQQPGQIPPGKPHARFTRRFFQTKHSLTSGLFTVFFVVPFNFRPGGGQMQGHPTDSVNHAGKTFFFILHKTYCFLPFVCYTDNIS